MQGRYYQRVRSALQCGQDRRQVAGVPVLDGCAVRAEPG